MSKIRWKKDFGYWRWPMYLAVWGTVAVVVVALLVGSTIAYDRYNISRGRESAPVAASDDSAALIINFPAGYTNVALKCVDGSGVYAPEGGGVFVVPNDPYCAEGES